MQFALTFKLHFDRRACVSAVFVMRIFAFDVLIEWVMGSVKFKNLSNASSDRFTALGRKNIDR